MDYTEQFVSTVKEWHYLVGGAAIVAIVAAIGFYRLAVLALKRPS